MALMKFIQNHGVDALKIRVGEQPPSQHSLGQESQPRTRPADVFESHLVASRFAQLFSQFARDATSGEPRRQPPWLQHENFATNATQEGRRYASGLAGARWRFDHQTALAPQLCNDPRKQIVDRKLHSETTARMVSGEFPSKRLLTKI